MTNHDKTLKDIGQIVKKERKAKLGNRNQAFLEMKLSPNTLKAIEEGKSYRMGNLLKVLEAIGFEVIIREKGE